MGTAQLPAGLGTRMSEARGTGAWKPLPGCWTWGWTDVVGRGLAAGGRQREAWGPGKMLTFYLHSSPGLLAGFHEDQAIPPHSLLSPRPSLLLCQGPASSGDPVHPPSTGTGWRRVERGPRPPQQSPHLFPPADKRTVADGGRACLPTGTSLLDSALQEATVQVCPQTYPQLPPTCLQKRALPPLSSLEPHSQDQEGRAAAVSVSIPQMRKMGPPHLHVPELSAKLGAQTGWAGHGSLIDAVLPGCVTLGKASNLRVCFLTCGRATRVPAS